MPLNLQKNLPAIELLKKEHIFVMDSLRASEQDIRPLRVVVLNLMPLKITTETDLVRLLSNTPLQVELDFMKIKGGDHADIRLGPYARYLHALYLLGGASGAIPFLWGA